MEWISSKILISNWWQDTFIKNLVALVSVRALTLNTSSSVSTPKQHGATDTAETPSLNNRFEFLAVVLLKL